MSAGERDVNANDFELDVRPAPSTDEAAAIVAALKMLRSARSKTSGEPVSAWRLAARSESLRGDLDHGPGGWRRNARLEP